VRKRLDLARAVPLEVIEECLRLAIQAPTGGNSQGWRWIVVTDPAKRAALADTYRKGWGPYLAANTVAAAEVGDPAKADQQRRVAESAMYLAEHLQEVPVHVIPCVLARNLGGDGTFPMAGLYGSIYPAVWSFQLALRSRGLGSVLTTLHLPYEGEAARLLDIPEGVVQVGLLPVAYYLGDDFKPASRRPVEEITYYDGWKRTRG